MDLQNYKHAQHRLLLLILCSFCITVGAWFLDTFRVGGCWAANGEELVVQRVQPTGTVISMGCTKPQVNGNDITWDEFSMPSGLHPSSVFHTTPWSISIDSVTASGVIRYNVSAMIMRLIQPISLGVALFALIGKIYIRTKKNNS